MRSDQIDNALVERVNVNKIMYLSKSTINSEKSYSSRKYSNEIVLEVQYK